MQHFLEVVDRAENDQKKFSDEYLRLLQTHVEQQRHQVQENSRRLLKKMRARERKEKVCWFLAAESVFEGTLDFFPAGFESAE